jgi:hypothetical protein
MSRSPKTFGVGRFYYGTTPDVCLAGGPASSLGT